MRTNYWILTLLLSLSFWGVSCVTDDLSKCTYVLKFKYDYNMDQVDLFSKKVDRIDLFVFDENGLFLQSFWDEAHTSFPKDYGVTLNLPTGKEYTFLTWAGLNYTHYDLNSLVPGKTSIRDVELSLRYRNIGSSNQQISPLWFGKERVMISGSGQKVISLIKDTNKFRIALRLLPTTEEKNPPKLENINVSIRSNNTLYDSNNNTLNSDLFTYLPYFLKNDDRGFIVELNTLRLIPNNTNELIFTNAKTHKELLKIDLNKYLEDLKFLENDKMDYQEFLDREDEFAVIIYLSGAEDHPFASFIVEINDWVIRNQEVDGQYMPV